MTLVLLPIEVDPLSINDPLSPIITLQVIASYRVAAGDFEDAVSNTALQALQELKRMNSFLIVSCVRVLSLCGMQTTIPPIMARIIVEVGLAHFFLVAHSFTHFFL
jgi:hypothetical protein